MTALICNTNPGKHADCGYGNHCCPSALHTAGHKRKRRVLKRRERNQDRRQREREAFEALMELEGDEEG